MFYYDVGMATSEGIDENGLLESLEDEGGHLNTEHIEYSAVSEVMAWLKAFRAAEAAR